MGLKMRTNKSPIETSLDSSDKKKNEIRRVLKENPQGLTPKLISFYSKVNYDTTKKLLKKMPDVKQKEGVVGYYVLTEKTNPSIFDCKIQNLRFTYSSDKINVEKRICEVNDLNNLIKFRFEIGLKSKKATLSVGTDYPLDFSCLGLLVYEFQNLMEKYCNFRPDIDQIFINTFEINKDYFNMTLEGCNSIRLDTLLFEYKLYYKEKKYVREEYKLKFPIDFAFMRTLVDKGLFYTETNQKIDNLSFEIKTLKKKIMQLTNILPRFLNNKQKFSKSDL